MFLRKYLVHFLNLALGTLTLHIFFTLALLRLSSDLKVRLSKFTGSSTYSMDKSLI